MQGLAVLAICVVGLIGYLGYLHLSGNLHEVSPGTVYRAGQIDGQVWPAGNGNTGSTPC